MELIHIENNFKEEVKNYKGLCIVDFWAPWCGPCKMFGPIFEETSKKYNNIKFCKINVDENQDIAKDYGVMSIPTIILFKDGVEVNRTVGFLNEDKLKEFLGEQYV